MNKSEKNASKQSLSDAGLPVWPSERIPPGGIYHTPKMEFSKETADLIRLLVKESKMSMMMRKQIDSSLRNGEPLPKPEPFRVNTSNDPDKETEAILQRARLAKRKSLEKIVSSGAYDVPYYRPPTDGRKLGEKDKASLQELMCGVKLSDPALKPLRKPRKEPKAVTEDDLINELLNQIQERSEWLSEMEELGQGKKFRAEIRDQINERLHQIRALESKAKLRRAGVRYVE